MNTARNDSSGVAPRPPAGQQHLPGAGGTSGLPQHGWSPQETLSRLEALRDRDVRWKDGRVFSLAYYASPEAHELATEAYRRFSGENALNVEAFPSLRTMQNDVLAIVARWLSAPPSARGFFTSGGTESILMAMKAAVINFVTTKLGPSISPTWYSPPRHMRRSTKRPPTSTSICAWFPCAARPGELIPKRCRRRRMTTRSCSWLPHRSTRRESSTL